MSQDQVVPLEFYWPNVTPDMPPWAGALIKALQDNLRIIARRVNIAVLEGLAADLPTAVGSRQLYWATDTSTLYYDSGTWEAV